MTSKEQLHPLVNYEDLSVEELLETIRNLSLTAEDSPMAIELFNKITRLIESKASTFCPQSNPNGVGEHSMPHWFIKAGSANKKFQSKAGIQSRIDYFSQLGSQKETSKDKEDGLQVLEARNLPRYHKVVFPLNSNLESHPDFINFHSPTKRFYVSFLNEKTGERKYFLDRDKESVLKDVADFKATVSEREDFNLEDYKIILSEYYPNLFSANIVVNQNGYLSIEVATGKHSQLTTGNVRLLMTLHLTNGHRLLRAQNNFRIVSDQYYQARTEAEKHISAVVKEKVFTDQILTENLRFELMTAINAALKMISVDPLSLNDDYLFSLPETFDDYLPFTPEPGYWEVIFTSPNLEAFAASEDQRLQPVFLDCRTGVIGGNYDTFVDEREIAR